MKRPVAPLLLCGALLLGAAACGGSADGSPPSADSPVVGPGDHDPAVSDGWDDFPVDPARQEARGLLGTHEDGLAASVRVARRGDETFALTEDYVLGRLTVELDDTSGDGYRVTSVTVELPDGPETYQLEAG